MPTGTSQAWGQRAGAGLTNGPRAATLAGSPGRPLDRDVSESFESRFGSDVRGVRVHTDAQAHHLARLLESKAFTVGNDIYFGASEYRPDTNEGRRLLTHELTHAVQPGRELAAHRAPYFTVDRPDSPDEHAATQEAARSDGYGTYGRTIRAAAGASGTRPLIHRQPTEEGAVKVPTVFIFSSQPNDVAGARKLANQLAEKIRQGTVTDEDLELRRQAQLYFKGRALTAFQQIIHSADKDRGVLSDVAKEAPPETGAGRMPGILVAPKLRPTSVADAKRIGKRHGDALRQAIISQDLRDEIEATIRFFEGDALVAYRAELTRAIAELRAKTERYQPSRQRISSQPSIYGEGFGPTTRFEETRTEVTPVSEPKVGFGFTFSLTAEVRDQTSDSVSVEVYTEHAVTTSAEVSGKIPLAEGTEFKVGISGSVKEGRKEARKSETANVRSTGKKVSRDYQVETLEREVVRTVHKETKDETRPKTGRGLVFVDEISDILVVDPNEAPGQLAANRKETQTGYRLTSKSGGSQQKRDIWPSYVGTTEFSAVDGFGSVLHDDGERLAREVAKLVAGGAF